MLTEKELDWENNKELTEEQKEFLRGADWALTELVPNTIQLWMDDNDSGIKSIDIILADIANDISAYLKRYAEYDMEDMIESMLESNFVDEDL